MRGLAAENPSLSAGALFGMGMAGVQPGTPAAKAAHEADQKVQAEKGNWFKRAISVTYKGIKAGGGAILPDVVGDTVNSIAPAIKGVSRGADIGLSAPGQLVQGWVRAGRGNNGDLGFDDLVSRNTWREAAEQTDLRQAHEYIQERGGYLGLATGSTDVDYGSGFFAGGEVGRRAGVKKQAATPERIDGKLPTIGRYLAREVGFEPGNTAYNVMSGLTDAAVMLGTDPTSFLGAAGGRTVAARAARQSFSGEASKGFDAAAAAAKVDEGLVATRSQQVDVTGLGRDQILAQAGALTGIRNTVNSDRALEWLTTSRQGTTVVEYLSRLGPNDFEKAWKATGGKVPADVLLQLTSREMTKDEVIAILGPTLGRTKTTGDKFGVDAVGQAQVGMGGLGTLATAKFKQSVRSVRAFGAMPERVLRKDDLDETLRNAHEFMNTALLKDTDVIKRGDRLVNRSTIMRRLAEVNGEEGMLEVAEDMMALGASKAASAFGVPQDKLDKLFRLYSEQTTGNRLYWQEQVVVNGEKAWVNKAFSRPGEKPTFKSGDETRPVPHLAAQFLDNSIPLPDVREIRREMSRYRNILNLPGVQPSLTTLNMLQEKMFKPFVLLRPAFTVRNQIDEQFRPAGVGMASLFSHPVQYLQWVMDDTEGMGRMLAKASGGRFASRGQTFGPEGQAFDELAERTRQAREAYKDAQRGGDLDLIAETKAAYEQSKKAVQSVTPFSDEVSEYTRAATGGAGNWRNMGYAQVNGNQVFRLEDSDYSRALGEGLHLLYNDPLVRRIVLDNDLDTIKQEWWQGSLTKYRTSLAQRDERMSYLNDEIGAARYVEDTVEFMRQFIGDSPELREAVRTGRIGDVPLTQGDTLTISARAIQKLDELKGVEGYQGPDGVIGSRVIKGGEDVSKWDQATNAMFYRLADQPTRVLARSPAFRQRYYKRMEDLIGFMDDSAASAAITAAQKAKLPAKDIKRLQAKRKPGGTLTWDEADLVAKGDALDFTNKLFYTLHHRNQFLDAARLIFPFGEAFKNSAVMYSKIVAGNPVLPYRLTQVIEGSRDADLNGDGKGFFYCVDDQTEALTSRGWLPHSQITEDDLLLTIDPASDEIRWEKPGGIHRFDYDGDLVRWQSGRIDALTTSSHRWLVEDWRIARPPRTTRRNAGTEGRRFRRTHEIGVSHQLVVGGGTPNSFAETATHSDEMVELIGWVVTEGYYTKRVGKNDTSVRVYQDEAANPEKTHRIRLLAKHFSTEGRTSEHHSRGTYRMFYFGKGIGSRIREIAPDKRLTPEFLRSLTHEQARLLYRTLIDGDGTCNKHGHESWAQSDVGRIAGFQMLTAMLGVRTRVLPSHTAGHSTVSVYRNRYTRIREGQSRTEAYAGIVWCPSLSTGMWMARRNGFTYWTGNTDEQTGEEMFGFPGSATLLRAVGLGGAGQMRAPVGNLNILGTSVVPGFGPAVQISAAMVLPDEADFNGVREFLSPYGDRTVEGGAFESFFPAWLQKWRTATDLASPAQQRAFANSTKDWMGYLASTGDYNLQDPEGQRQLLNDAKSKARSTWFVRGLAQFVAPSPPSPEFVAYDKDGRLLTQFRLAEEYRRIQTEQDEAGTPEATDRIFIETFGEQAVLAIIPNTKPGEDKSPLPPNREALEFYQRNKGAAQRFPGVFGLFAPDPEAAEFDFVTYNRQLSSGERVVITPQEAIKRANQKVARMIVNQANAAVEQVAPRGEDGRPKPTKEQRAALTELKAKLSEDFPGYSVAFSNDTPALLEDLKRAAKDPELGKTPAGEALNVYLQARDMAEEAAQAQFGSGWRQSNKAASIRAAMRMLGEQLSDDFVGFRNIYERVLEREMAQDDPVAPEQEEAVAR